MAWWKRFGKKPRQRPQLKSQFRLNFDTLEDRAVPAMFLASTALPTVQGDAASGLTASRGSSFSADGRYFVFYSDADNLVAGDNNHAGDIFVADLQQGTINLVSSDAAGNPATSDSGTTGSFDPSISADGRYVTFMSYATNLVSANTGGTAEIYVKDLQSGTVTLASADAEGQPLDTFNFYPAISADGRYVAFVHYESTDSSLTSVVYRKDLQTGALALVSTNKNGASADGPANHPAISADGTVIAFSSVADNLVDAPVSGAGDIFRKNMTTGDVTLVSAGADGGGNGVSDLPSISADGSHVSFESSAIDLVPNDTNNARDIFVADLGTNTIRRVSTDSAGNQLTGNSYNAWLTPDASKIVFTSAATDAVDVDTNGQPDVFVKDLESGAVTRVDTSATGAQARLGATPSTLSPSDDRVAFVSTSGDLVPGDNNALADVFVKSLTDGSITIVSTGTSTPIGGTGDSVLTGRHPSISDNGEFVVYTSAAGNLVSGPDTGSLANVYWVDRSTGQTVRVSAATDGTPGDAASSGASITGDGTLVAFQSTADNIVGDTGGHSQVFLASPQAGVSVILSQTLAGTVGNGDSTDVVLSRDGHWAVFVTRATNLFEDATPNYSDVVIEDLTTGAMQLVSANAQGQQGSADATAPSVSDDGRFVTFLSSAQDLLPGVTGGQPELYLKDLVTGTLTLVSQTSDGTPANGAVNDAAISGDGHTIAFVSTATNLVSGTTGTAAVYVANVSTGAIQRVDMAPTGDPTNGAAGGVSISDNGRYVSFDSTATNLIPDDTTDNREVFVADMTTGSISLLSPGTSGAPGNGDSQLPSLSRDGRYVAFTSRASDLTADTVGVSANVFVNVRDDAPSVSISGPATIAEGNSLMLDASATTDPNGDSLTFGWDLNGDGVDDVTGPVLSLTWSQLQNYGFDDGPSVHVITLHVTDAFGPIDVPITLQVTNTPPTPTIVVDSLGALEGQTSTFHGTATDPSSTDTTAGFSYSWSVTQGGMAIATGDGASFLFTPNDNGDYTVTLSVADQDGDTGTTTYDLQIGNAPPVVDLSNAPTITTPGTAIDFAGSASDPGPSDQAMGLDVTWAVTKDGQPYTTGSGTNVSFTPDATGSYVVAMSATDKDQATTTATATIAVANQPPSLTLTGASTFSSGIAYSLGFDSVDPGSGTITGYTVDWGDGNVDSFDGSPAGQTQQHTYSGDATTYTINVSVIEADATTPVATKTLTDATVSTPPSITLDGASSVNVGDTYTLTLGQVTESESVIGYVVHWGDGQDSAGDSTPPASLTHVYSAAGNDTITIDLTDVSGTHAAVSSLAVTVNAVQSTTPSITLDGPGTVYVGDTYTLTLGAVTGSVGVTGYVVHWGDGQDSSGDGTPPTSLMHVYTAAADDTITIDLIDVTGTHAAVASLNVSVINSNPAISLDGADTVEVGDIYTISLGAVTGSDSVSGFVVDWGDGQSTSGNGTPPSSMWHVYGNAGNYAITIGLTDNSGPHAGLASKALSVTTPSIPLDGADTVNIGDSYTLTLGTVTGTNSVTGYVVHWGDGQDTTDTGTPPSSLTHTYMSAGTATITIDLTDDIGTHAAVASHTVTVNTSTPSITLDGPDTVVVGDTYTLTLGTVTGSDTVSGYVVHWGDGQDSLGDGTPPASLTHTYTSVGTDSITIDLIDASGTHAAVASQNVTVTTPPPLISLDGPDTINVADSYTLTVGAVTGSDSVTGYVVHWGDGQDSSGDGTPPASLTHTYTSAATDTITIDLTDASGTHAAVASHTVTVTATTPAITLDGADTVNVGDNYTLTVGAVTGSDSVTGYVVHWGDGQDSSGDGTPPTELTHTYTSAGTETITIDLTDASGTHAAVASHTVAATATNPAITLDGPSNVNTGDTYTLTLGTVTGSDTVTGYVVHWGDGNASSGAGTPPTSLTHNYTSTGNDTITIDMTDASGNHASIATHAVTVTTPPAPSFASGDSLTLNGSGIFTHTIPFTDPGAGPWTGTVDYGDGQGAQTLTIDSTGRTFTLSHTYTQDGSYTVTVTLANSFAQSSGTDTVSVVNLPAPPDTTSPPVVSVGSDTTATVGQAITRDGSFTDTGTGTVTATVDYGDGGGAQTLTLSSTSFHLSHTYATAGTFTVTVAVTDGAKTGTATFHIAATDPTQTTGEDPTPTTNDGLADLVGRDPQTGAWFLGQSNGSSFTTSNFNGIFDPSKTWVDALAADFTGDGRTDIVARDAATGQWSLAKNTGTSFVVSTWDSWSTTANWTNVTALDLDNDGKFDIVGLDSNTGTWTASFSLGDHGASVTIGTMPTTSTWTDIHWADVNGDHRPDLSARISNTGTVDVWFNHAASGATGSSAQLVTSTSNFVDLSSATTPPASSQSSTTTPSPMSALYGTFWRLFWQLGIPAPQDTTSTQSTDTSSSSSQTTWNNLLVGDLTGDGNADIVAQNGTTGAWTVAVSQGDHATASVWTGLSTTVQWSNVRLVDLNHDGKRDILARNNTDGTWWGAFSTGTGFTTQMLGTTDPGQSYADSNVIVGDYNGDGKQDIAIRTASGAINVGVSTGTALQFSVWDTWPTTRVDLRSGFFV
jgi:hypothetical protein